MNSNFETPETPPERRQSIRTFLISELIPDEGLPGDSVVVIDVLRASTTIVHALSAGARGVHPFLTIEETLAKAERLAADPECSSVQRGGERGGIKIDGFDLGNSPVEYTPEVVSDATICFTTTNGTKALQRSLPAAKIMIGCLINRQAVVQELVDDDSIALVCAGTNGVVTLEDVYAAGAIVESLQLTNPLIELDDSSRLALSAWTDIPERALCSLHNMAESPLGYHELRVGSEEVSPVPTVATNVEAKPKSAQNSENLHDSGLINALRETQGGRNLIRLGKESDINIAAQLDRFRLVPVYDSEQEILRRP